MAFGSVWDQEPRNALEGVQSVRSIKKTISNRGTCKRPLSALFDILLNSTGTFEHFQRTMGTFDISLEMKNAIDGIVTSEDFDKIFIYS